MTIQAAPALRQKADWPKSAMRKQIPLNFMDKSELAPYNLVFLAIEHLRGAAPPGIKAQPPSIS
jgi:hypothetical protein